MPHAVDEEGILLAHDLGRHLEDRLGALVEAARQPIGALQAIGQKVLLGLVLGVAGDIGEIDLVDQDPRQRVGVELDRPAAVIGRPDQRHRQ